MTDYEYLYVKSSHGDRSQHPTWRILLICSFPAQSVLVVLVVLVSAKQSHSSPLSSTSAYILRTLLRCLRLLHTSCERPMWLFGLVPTTTSCGTSSSSSPSSCDPTQPRVVLVAVANQSVAVAVVESLCLLRGRTEWLFNQHHSSSPRLIWSDRSGIAMLLSVEGFTRPGGAP